MTRHSKTWGAYLNFVFTKIRLHSHLGKSSAADSLLLDSNKAVLVWFSQGFPLAVSAVRETHQHNRVRQHLKPPLLPADAGVRARPLRTEYVADEADLYMALAFRPALFLGQIHVGASGHPDASCHAPQCSPPAHGGELQPEGLHIAGFRGVLGREEGERVRQGQLSQPQFVPREASGRSDRAPKAPDSLGEDQTRHGPPSE